MSTDNGSAIEVSLAELAPPEIVKRINGLLIRGQTAPLSADKAQDLFILYVVCGSLEGVAKQAGIPLDVMFLTAAQYNWKQKRADVLVAGEAALMGQVQKNLVNQLLIATQSTILKQVGDVMSGKIAPEKCPLLPRSLHGLKLLLELVKEVNQVNQPQTTNTTNVIHAQNVQVNQQLPAAKKPEVDKLHAMKLMAGEKDD